MLFSEDSMLSAFLPKWEISHSYVLLNFIMLV